MVANADQICGECGLVVLLVGFTYYTIWVILVVSISFISNVILQPFVDSEHYILKYFPPREYAILFIVIIGVMMLVLSLTLVGITLIKSDQKKK